MKGFAFASHIVWACAAVISSGAANPSFEIDQDAAVHLPATTIPFSKLASPAAREEFLASRGSVKEAASNLGKLSVLTPEIANQLRSASNSHSSDVLKRLRDKFPVVIETKNVGSVVTHIVTPRNGVSAANANRILISLAGGAFVTAGPDDGDLQAAPLASMARVKVVSINYRQAPEYRFPAATEDVVAVYRDLLQAHASGSIGIYGCSAGGLLTAEVMARIIEEKLPSPGALGIFCASAIGWAEGDSGQLAYRLVGMGIPAGFLRPPHPEISNIAYFDGVDLNDPLVLPGHFQDTLSKFSPTLLITTTRDISLSGAAYTHTQLTKAGVESDLQVWDGVGHGFFVDNPTLPESQDAWRIIWDFFDKHLDAAHGTAGPIFEIAVPASARLTPLTGRILLVISRKNAPEPVVQGSGDNPETFAVAADQLAPGRAVAIDGKTLGYPLRALKDVPAGDYYVQAYAKVYVDYRRPDGRVFWGLDQWDGQDGADSPGNLRSAVQTVHLGGTNAPTVKLELTKVTPPRPAPADSEWVKNVKIRSELLSKFWGRPIYLGATVVLPKDYAAHPERSYPMIYEPRNHYRRDGPFTFTTANTPETEDERALRESHGVETGYQFYKAWSGPDFPRVITATLINTTPFYDLSGMQNSVNIGPYDDAVMQELIPYLETHFHIIHQPWARMLVGKSSGGRDAFALQLHHPDFFGGIWVFYPWAFNYRKYFSFDVYRAKNAFVVDWTETQGFRGKDEWQPLDRIFVRTLDDRPIWTVRSWILGEVVNGGVSGVGAELAGSDNALNSPMGPDGNPLALFDKLTGVIDPHVAETWRQHDLMAYVEDNWPTIGSKLVGKIHFAIGDMDEWFRNYGVRDLQAYLEKAKPYYAGSFTYGPLKGHEWQPMTNADLVRQVSDYMVQHAPKDADMAWQKDN